MRSNYEDNDDTPDVEIGVIDNDNIQPVDADKNGDLNEPQSKNVKIEKDDNDEIQIKKYQIINENSPIF
mgnify:CR=1 FL=1